MIRVAHYSLIKPADWRWRYFTPAELSCKADGSLQMDEAFLDLLSRLREACDCALPVTSAWRTPAYNASVSDSGDDGPHTTGKAVDLHILGAQARTVIGAAIQLGFTGIGLRQHGSLAKRLIHLDTIAATATSPRPWVWTYDAPK